MVSAPHPQQQSASMLRLHVAAAQGGPSSRRQGPPWEARRCACGWRGRRGRGWRDLRIHLRTQHELRSGGAGLLPTPGPPIAFPPPPLRGPPVPPLMGLRVPPTPGLLQVREITRRLHALRLEADQADQNPEQVGSKRGNVVKGSLLCLVFISIFL